MPIRTEIPVLLPSGLKPLRINPHFRWFDIPLVGIELDSCLGDIKSQVGFYINLSLDG